LKHIQLHQLCFGCNKKLPYAKFNFFITMYTIHSNKDLILEAMYSTLQLYIQKICLVLLLSSISNFILQIAHLLLINSALFYLVSIYEIHFSYLLHLSIHIHHLNNCIFSYFLLIYHS